METEQSDATNYEKVRTLDHSLRKIFLIQVFINTLRVLCKNTDKISSLDCNLFEIVFVNRQNLKHFKFISLWQKSSFKVYKTFLLDIFKNHLREKIWILAQAIEQCFQKKKKKKMPNPSKFISLPSQVSSSITFQKNSISLQSGDAFLVGDEFLADDSGGFSRGERSAAITHGAWPIRWIILATCNFIGRVCVFSLGPVHRRLFRASSNQRASLSRRVATQRATAAKRCRPDNHHLHR